MMFSNAVKSVLVGLLATLVLAGCESTAPETTSAPDDGGVDRTEQVTTDRAVPEPVRTNEWETDADGNPISQRTGRPLGRTFYFGFDDAVLRQSTIEVLAHHARYLRENRNRRIVLEGHCDERGTREYNLALGERRADAASTYLMAEGVRRSQIENVSYGEERPVDPGHSESAWSRNRRVELMYR